MSWQKQGDSLDVQFGKTVYRCFHNKEALLTSLALGHSLDKGRGVASRTPSSVVFCCSCMGSFCSCGKQVNQGSLSQCVRRRESVTLASQIYVECITYHTWKSAEGYQNWKFFLNQQWISSAPAMFCSMHFGSCHQQLRKVEDITCFCAWREVLISEIATRCSLNNFVSLFPLTLHPSCQWCCPKYLTCSVQLLNTTIERNATIDIIQISFHISETWQKSNLTSNSRFNKRLSYISMTGQLPVFPDLGFRTLKEPKLWRRKAYLGSDGGIGLKMWSSCELL